MMQRKIKAVEKAMVEEMENLTIDTGEKAMEAEVERLAKQENSSKIRGTTRNHHSILMKDIELDQISDFSLYGRSRRKANDDPMLELWETVETEPNEEQSLLENAVHSSSSSELFFEKDLNIDKPVPRGHNRILERLASDAQKLTSLQRSVQDLKRKMETATMTRGKKANNAAEFETVQMQILEVEEAVTQLASINGQLTKDVEDPSLIASSEDSGKVRRRKVTEQARKGAEKIGQLQFEVQNIHYILLKLDDESSKGKEKGKVKRFAESKTGVLLRDFIYSSRRRRQRRKKGCFCGCTRPATRED